MREPRTGVKKFFLLFRWNFLCFSLCPLNNNHPTTGWYHPMVLMSFMTWWDTVGVQKQTLSPPHLPRACRELTEQLHCTHWFGWRLGKSSLVVNISPCWYVVPLYWQDLTGARRPEGECGSGKEDEKAAG